VYDVESTWSPSSPAVSTATTTDPGPRVITASHGRVTTAGRLARHGHGHITLHLPDGSHCEQEWASLLQHKMIS
jgi:hypothetical protein